MIRSFRDAPIQKKIVAIILLTSGLVLAGSSVVFVINEAVSFRADARKSLESTANLIGSNSVAAVMFKDRQVAAESLAGLQKNESILAAYLLTGSNEILASYVSGKAAPGDLPAGMGIAGDHRIVSARTLESFRENAGSWNFHAIDAVSPIMIEGQRAGTVVLRASFRELGNRMKRYFILSGLILLCAFFGAYLLSLGLASEISRPVVELARTMKAVTNEQNFGLRCESRSGDEIGELVEGFNKMLSLIQARDEKLLRHREELVRARDTAEAASVAKSQFLAKMSHEIRTPMNGILGMTDLLLQESLPGDQRRSVEIVRRSGETLLEIINDILDFSRIEAGRMELDDTPFDPGEIVEEVIELLSQRARPKGIELASQVSPEIPSALRGDPGRLRQILVNLVGNAVKFTESGEVVVRASLDARDAVAATVRFSVRDTGIGIPAGTQAKIFEAFTQADGSTTRKFGGTGLGLTISRQLVEMMGGTIRVESELGKGSEFIFIVPLRTMEGSDLRPSVARSDLNGLKVLVADDNRTNREILERRILLVEDNPANQEVTLGMLSFLGCEADVAGNGREALDAIAAREYDLVLMDCHMPVMDGYAATRALRVREKGTGGKHLIVVALTANAMQGDSDSCLAAGMDDYLSKPFTIRKLGDMVTKWTLVEPNPAGSPIDKAACRVPRWSSPG